MKTLKSSGLLDLAQKYTSKVLNVKPKLVQVSSSRRLISVYCKLDFVVSKQQTDSLFRILKIKGFKVKKFNCNTQHTSQNNPKTVLTFDLELLKRTRKPKKMQIKAIIRKQTMNREYVLADSLAQGMRYQIAVNSLDRQLKASNVEKVEADASNKLGLKVMRHGDGARLVQTIYQDYVSDKDYTNFLDFFLAVDRILYEFRGNKELDLNSLQDEEDDDVPKRSKGKRGSGGRRSFAPKGGSALRPKPSVDVETSTDPSDQSVVISKTQLNSNPSRDKIKSMLNKYYGK